MLMPSQGMRILVATKPVDFRKGHDGLAALAQSMLAENPFTGTVFASASFDLPDIRGRVCCQSLAQDYTPSASLAPAPSILCCS